MPKESMSPDHETRLDDDHHLALRLWLRLLTCTNLVENELRSLLRTDFSSTLPRFDFLAQLERVDDGLSMGELSKRLMVSGGNVTGIAEQLAREGLISRSSPPNNRRTFFVKLTPKGRRYFKKMARAHETWIIRFFTGLKHGEQEQMMALLQKLKVHLKQTLEH